jgi:hypothetical protein
MDEKYKEGIRAEEDEQLNNIVEYSEKTNEEITNYNVNEDNFRKQNENSTNERHNNNARETAALDSNYPRINTDNL